VVQFDIGGFILQASGAELLSHKVLSWMAVIMFYLLAFKFLILNLFLFYQKLFNWHCSVDYFSCRTSLAGCFFQIKTEALL
jgi:hypothetical protein